MNTMEIDQIKNDLTQWLNDFSATSDRTAIISADSKHYSDPVDMAAAQLEMDYLFHIVSRKGLSKANALNALRKIEEGSYGYCEACEEEIPIERLKAIPDARYCISCQAQLEKMVA